MTAATSTATVVIAHLKTKCLIVRFVELPQELFRAFSACASALGEYRLGRPKAKVNGEKFKKIERGYGAGRHTHRARYGIE
jgi:hypothetical protein